MVVAFCILKKLFQFNSQLCLVMVVIVWLLAELYLINNTPSIIINKIYTDSLKDVSTDTIFLYFKL